MTDKERFVQDRMREEPEEMATEIMERWRFAHVQPPRTAEEAESLARCAQADVAVLYNLFMAERATR